LSAPVALKSRIVGHGEVDPAELMANPLNWRVHPTHQRHAVLDALKQVGWVQEVIVNKMTGHMVDGHLRADIAVERGEKKIPVQYVELSEAEERLVLATLDSLTALAVADADNLTKLMEDLDVQGDVLSGFLDDLADAVGPIPDAPIHAPNPADFWPRVAFQLPPNVYSEWREVFEEFDGDEDHDKIIRMLEVIKRGEQE
jgi:hypothetical protein